MALLKRTRTRQALLRDLDAARTPDFSRDLHDNLINQYYDVPAPRRRRSCWVMNREWWDECAKIGDWPWQAPGTAMLGLPVHVTEDGGFPHLIAD